MAAVPMLAGVGLLSMCCISSSIASTMMGGEEKKVPDGKDKANKAQAAADEAQTAADAVAADPNSTPEEVATAQTVADTAQEEATPTPDPAAPPSAWWAAYEQEQREAERVRLANMSFREKVMDGQYPTFAGCWAAAGPGTGSGADKFACCESIGTPYPDYGDTGWAYCNDNT